MKKLLAAAILMASGVMSYASQPSVFVSMKMEQNGAAIAQPSLLVASAQQAEVAVGDRFQIELTAVDLADRADLQMKVYAKVGRALNLVGTPRVVAVYGQEAVVAWRGAAGASYRLTVKPVRGERSTHEARTGA